MIARKSEKDKEITRLKRELNKVNNDLRKKKGGIGNQPDRSLGAQG